MRPTRENRVWDWYGRYEPYFGVLSEKCNLSTHCDNEARSKFFASGEADLQRVLDIIHRELAADFSPVHALDFGSGVGRLTFPLARQCETATGVDVSSGMREEARRNAIEFGISNVQFLPDLNAAGSRPKYDFLISLIVFQHIPRAQGEVLLEEAVNCLSPGGFGVVELPMPQSPLLRLASRLTALLQSHPQLYSRLVRQPPPMGMHHYNPDRCRKILEAGNCTVVFSQERRHGRFSSMLIFFRKR